MHTPNAYLRPFLRKKRRGAPIAMTAKMRLVREEEHLSFSSLPSSLVFFLLRVHKMENGYFAAQKGGGGEGGVGGRPCQ